jgi:photoactive yellow protein
MNQPNHALNIESENLAASLDQMSDAEIDALPFGVILIGKDNKVLKYSKKEAFQSGYGVDRTPPIGLDFFGQLAPCMDTPQFRGQIEKAAQTGKVDIECGHTGDFADRSRFFRIRIMSAGNGGYWQIHDRGNTP